MASSALEEKINKIRLQNEEIRRRYEEVEADKKNAAKSNALVQLVPSDDWPERKEPPEFSAPPKNAPRPKVQNKEHVERPSQHYPGSVQERLERKGHKFSAGDGPPPDPKYNFLADSEREMRRNDEGQIIDEKNKSKNKGQRGGPRKRGGIGAGRGGGNEGGGSREAFFKDNRGPHAFHSREDSLPEYEAWRAERNRIDEARINRQKTAEGNWRREWDNNKIPVEKDNSRKEFVRKDSNNYERRNNHYENDYSNRGHGGSRTYHGSQKTYGNQDYRRPMHQPQEQTPEFKRQPESKTPLSPTDDRTVTAFDQSIKVTVNHGNQPTGTLMSVKVNSPSIAGTGRVGPRQKSRITYSSQSDTHEINTFSRQKSFDEKTAETKSPFAPRKKEGNPKSPFPTKKEFRNDESTKGRTKALHSQRNESRDQRQSDKPQRVQKRITKNNFPDDDAIPSEYNPDKLYRNNQNYVNVNETNEGFSDLLKNADEPSSNNENVDCESIMNNIGNYEETVDEVIEKTEIQYVECNNAVETDVSKENETSLYQQNEVSSVGHEKIVCDETEKEVKSSTSEEESQILISDNKNDGGSIKTNENNVPTVDQTSSSNTDNQENDKDEIQDNNSIAVTEKVEEIQNEDDNKLEQVESDKKIDITQEIDEKLKSEEGDKELNITQEIVEEIKSENIDITQEVVEKLESKEDDEKIEIIKKIDEKIESEESDEKIDIQVSDEKVEPIKDIIETIVQEIVEKPKLVENDTQQNDEKIEDDLSLSKNANDSGFVENSMLDDLQESDKNSSESNESMDKSNSQVECNTNDSEELEKTNSIDATKEIREKTVEICDIHSAASEAMGNEKIENPTKDTSEESTI